MTLATAGPTGHRQVATALAAGAPVLVPMPSPITYALCAGDPAALNRAKGRPEDQPVGLAVPDLRRVAPHLGLDGAALDLVRWLMGTELVSVLAPVLPGAPVWMAPCVVEGHVSLIGSWLATVAALLEAAGPVYVSSSNPTGGHPAATAAEADAAFGGRLLTLDGDGLRDPAAAHGSSTVVRVDAGGGLELVRAGVRAGVGAGSLAGDRDAAADLLERYRDRAGPSSGLR